MGSLGVTSSIVDLKQVMKNTITARGEITLKAYNSTRIHKGDVNILKNMGGAIKDDLAGAIVADLKQVDNKLQEAQKPGQAAAVGGVTIDGWRAAGLSIGSRSGSRWGEEKDAQDAGAA